MHSLSNTDRSNSRGNLQGEGWDAQPAYGTMPINKEQIKQANSIPIISVLGVYGIKINQYTKHIMCPFKQRHKDGQDKSPSFTIYPHTNSFWCFGCKTGSTPIDFVMNKRNISFHDAVIEILQILSNEINIDNTGSSTIDFNQRLDILVKFSSFIRSKISSSNPLDLEFIENICATFDEFNRKYNKNMTNDALQSIVDILQHKINEKLI